jgi:hypothetical protein
MHCASSRRIPNSELYFSGLTFIGTCTWGALVGQFARLRSAVNRLGCLFQAHFKMATHSNSEITRLLATRLPDQPWEAREMHHPSPTGVGYLSANQEYVKHRYRLAVGFKPSHCHVGISTQLKKTATPSVGVL